MFDIGGRIRPLDIVSGLNERFHIMKTVTNRYRCFRQRDQANRDLGEDPQRAKSHLKQIHQITRTTSV